MQADILTLSSMGCHPLSVVTAITIQDENAAARRDPHNRDTCLDGYVWREAVQGDHVCVVPRSRDIAAYDNRYASSRIAR